MKKKLTTLGKKKLVIEALDDIKAHDIQAIDVRKVTSIFDWIIVASADSARPASISGTSRASESFGLGASAGGGIGAAATRVSATCRRDGRAGAGGVRLTSAAASGFETAAGVGLRWNSPRAASAAARSALR